MKKISSIMLFVIISMTNVFSQVNLDKFEDEIVYNINKYRKDNGVDTLVKYDSLKIVAKMECDYISNIGGFVIDPYFINNMESVFGSQVKKSFNSNLVAFWDTKTFDSFHNIESRMAEGYILQVIDDKMTHLILKSYKPDNSQYLEYIGVESVIVNNVVYMSVVIFITKY